MKLEGLEPPVFGSGIRRATNYAIAIYFIYLLLLSSYHIISYHIFALRGIESFAPLPSSGGNDLHVSSAQRNI